ncbi:SDR family oxidoreductase [Rhodococcus zopfii]|uniref:SDR family oxidoreductase n=1 Tax=Rhodococcus zopfii TaxID=43772 RepID=A0ABU3WX03_9NOCA|nr:SDR family oxidoreductase [Rhodococcus zopfii]MDV2478528.1 SDR family oxidoreductase [Rhodococcus zopfii]
MLSLNGTVAIVTGASRGIGLGIAQHLVDSGARVCLTARKEDDLRAAADELGGPERAIYVAGNSSDPAHQDETIEKVTAAFGPVDLLVNNTGINPVYGPMIELDLDAARKVIEVNCLATLSWTQKVVAAGMGERGGSIVNISSTSALRPESGIGLYGASKAMLSHMTMQLAVELAPRIRVNAIAPAVVKTRFAAALYEGREEQVSAAYPMQRLGVPDDIGGAAAFLASSESAWMTGQTVVVDGGLTLTFAGA